MDRREFVKWGAAGVAGLAVPGLGLELLSGAGSAFGAEHSRKVWKFGVMADTQWQKNLDGLNPGTCAVGIVNLLNAEFVKHGVKFVIQVGDLIDQETDAANGNPGNRTMPVRAQAAQALYDAGIGFFPLRGNHEGSATAANEFVSLYPQARGAGSRVFGATNFSSPFAKLNGLSYSFDYHNVRIVLIDQFTRLDGTNSSGGTDGNTIDQLSWIENSLAERPAGTHAFVLGHKNLIGQDHVDTLLGADPHANASARNEFIGALESNGVRYYVGGHDHHHHRSIVSSPDGKHAVKQMISSSNSYKFYTPAKPSNDQVYDNPTVELAVAQEAYTVGYYIFTVDGPRVTVDFFSTSPGLPYNVVPLGLSVTPTNTAFYHRDRWGYSLNGKEFVVGQGGSYNVISDSFGGTHAKVLGGINGSTKTDRALRPLSKVVNTGWADQDLVHHGTASNVLSLWGMAENVALWDSTQTALLPASDATQMTDTFTLAMTYDPHRVGAAHLGNGGFGIGTKGAHGRWVNAVSLNTGGTKRFVKGPWTPGYALGTYGVDPSTKTAWAVLNFNGDFAVTGDI